MLKVIASLITLAVLFFLTNHVGFITSLLIAIVLWNAIVFIPVIIVFLSSKNNGKYSPPPVDPSISKWCDAQREQTRNFYDKLIDKREIDDNHLPLGSCLGCYVIGDLLGKSEAEEEIFITKMKKQYGEAVAMAALLVYALSTDARHIIPPSPQNERYIDWCIDNSSNKVERLLFINIKARISTRRA